MNAEITYIADAAVDPDMDRRLRELFTTCFTGPQDRVFHKRRYYRMPYPHRWIIQNQHGEIIAHTGVHEKELMVNEIVYRVGGVAEVCVQPDFRGRGYVRTLLFRVHEWLAANGFVFALLFGDPAVYRSSGYIPAANLFGASADPGETPPEPLSFVQVKPLAEIPWPAVDVFMTKVPF